MNKKNIILKICILILLIINISFGATSTIKNSRGEIISTERTIVFQLENQLPTTIRFNNNEFQIRSEVGPDQYEWTSLKEPLPFGTSLGHKDTLMQLKEATSYEQGMTIISNVIGSSSPTLPTPPTATDTLKTDTFQLTINPLIGTGTTQLNPNTQPTTASNTQAINPLIGTSTTQLTLGTETKTSIPIILGTQYVSIIPKDQDLTKGFQPTTNLELKDESKTVLDAAKSGGVIISNIRTNDQKKTYADYSLDPTWWSKDKIGNINEQVWRDIKGFVGQNVNGETNSYKIEYIQPYNGNKMIKVGDHVFLIQTIEGGIAQGNPEYVGTLKPNEDLVSFLSKNNPSFNSNTQFTFKGENTAIPIQTAANPDKIKISPQKQNNDDPYGGLSKAEFDYFKSPTTTAPKKVELSKSEILLYDSYLRQQELINSEGFKDKMISQGLTQEQADQKYDSYVDKINTAKQDPKFQLYLQSRGVSSESELYSNPQTSSSSVSQIISSATNTLSSFDPTGISNIINNGYSNSFDYANSAFKLTSDYTPTQTRYSEYTNDLFDANIEKPVNSNDFTLSFRFDKNQEITWQDYSTGNTDTYNPVETSATPEMVKVETPSTNPTSAITTEDKPVSATSGYFLSNGIKWGIDNYNTIEGFLPSMITGPINTLGNLYNGLSQPRTNEPVQTSAKTEVEKVDLNLNKPDIRDVMSLLDTNTKTTSTSVSEVSKATGTGTQQTTSTTTDNTKTESTAITNTSNTNTQTSQSSSSSTSVSENSNIQKIIDGISNKIKDKGGLPKVTQDSEGNYIVSETKYYNDMIKITPDGQIFSTPIDIKIASIDSRISGLESQISSLQSLASQGDSAANLQLAGLSADLNYLKNQKKDLEGIAIEINQAIVTETKGVQVFPQYSRMALESQLQNNPQAAALYKYIDVDLKDDAKIKELKLTKSDITQIEELKKLREIGSAFIDKEKYKEYTATTALITELTAKGDYRTLVDGISNGQITLEGLDGKTVTTQLKDLGIGQVISMKSGILQSHAGNTQSALNELAESIKNNDKLTQAEKDKLYETTKKDATYAGTAQYQMEIYSDWTGVASELEKMLGIESPFKGFLESSAGKLITGQWEDLMCAKEIKKAEGEGSIMDEKTGKVVAHIEGTRRIQSIESVPCYDNADCLMYNATCKESSLVAASANICYGTDGPIEDLSYFYYITFYISHDKSGSYRVYSTYNGTQVEFATGSYSKNLINDKGKPVTFESRGIVTQVCITAPEIQLCNNIRDITGIGATAGQKTNQYTQEAKKIGDDGNKKDLIDSILGQAGQQILNGAKSGKDIGDINLGVQFG